MLRGLRAQLRWKKFIWATEKHLFENLHEILSGPIFLKKIIKMGKKDVVPWDLFTALKIRPKRKKSAKINIFQKIFFSCLCLYQCQIILKGQLSNTKTLCASWILIFLFLQPKMAKKSVFCQKSPKTSENGKIDLPYFLTWLKL